MEVASKGLIALGAWSFWIHDVIKTIGCKLNSLTLKVEWTRRHVDEYDDWIADGDENDENDYAENKHRREMWCGRGLLNGFLVDCIRWAPYVKRLKNFVFDCQSMDLSSVF